MYSRLRTICDEYTYTTKFQEIFLVSLPERTDRRDSFAVQARLSNISFTVVDGVDGTTVSDKALPYVSLPAYMTLMNLLTLCQTMDLTSPQVGCWRAHMNIMQE